MTRKTWVLAGAAGIAVIVGLSVATSTGKQTASAAQAPPTTTAKVAKQTLSAMTSLHGTLTYQAGSDGSPYSVINRAQGAYTSVPELGQVISQGQVLYRVDDSPVVLLDGAIPAYRTLSAGTTGADVAQLNADLVALGYASSRQLSSVSTSFGSATTTALMKLEGTLGIAQNGTLSLGQAIFEPAAVRVTALSVPLGSAAQGGQTVMNGTSTTRQVQVALDASQQSEVGVGNKVDITLPNNKTTPGVVSAVGTVASCPPSSASGGTAASSVTVGTGICSSGSSGSAVTPTVTVNVTPSDPAATGTWDQAPVQVTITTTSVPDALVVPVTALLARSGVGYAVEVVDPRGRHHLATVSLGLFDDADGLVQVTGSKLVVGQEVVVPTS